jgi:tetratricopeptide (TPR) repeat protein
MSIFEAMERLAGAALLALAPALKVAVPTRQRGRGMDLVQMLRQRGAGDLVDGYVGELTREIWVGAETRSLPQEALERHFRDLAAIIATCDLSDEAIAGALAPAPGGDRARRIAIDLFLKSRDDGALEAHGLSEDVALFVLERSFARLLRDPQRISALSPLVAEFSATPEPATDATPQVTPATEAARPADAAPAASPAAAPAPAAQSAPVASSSPASKAPAASVAGPMAPQAAPGAAAPQRREARETAELARIREKYEISEVAQSRLLVLLDSQGVTGDQRLTRFEALSAWLQEARAQLMRPTNEDGDLRKLKTRAAEALAAGDLLLAMETLKHVRRALRDGRRRIEARLEDEVSALKVQMTEEARATARLAELAVARRDFSVAADLFFEAADCLPKSGRDEVWRYHLARADALFRKAEEDDDEAALGEALAGYGGVLKLLADGSNARAAALANLGLGRALHRQAEGTTGVGRLADAIGAFRKAVALISVDDAPVMWAETHGALARSLSLSGQRARQLPMLREAVDAYRAALSAARDELPTSLRIELQTGIGATLLEMAEYDKSTDVLDAAAAAYTAALTLLSRAESPDAWADASLNLGSALLALSDTNRDPRHLKGAVEALSGALEVLSIERNLEAWTTATVALADALAALAEAEAPSADRLRVAIATYRRVLEVVDRAVAPISWATASMNLGSTLIRLGELEDKRNNWLAAAAAMVPALDVFEAEGATAHADLARRTLKRFHEEWVGLLAPPLSGPVAPVATPHLSKVG